MRKSYDSTFTFLKRSGLKSGLLFLLLFLFAGMGQVFGQTEGQIYKPATGNGADILDPGQTGNVFVGGIVGNGTVIGYNPLLQLSTEPEGDVRTGASGGHTDFVSYSGNSAAYMYYDSDNDALLFRVRIGKQSTASKGYTFLFNTGIDLFGPKASNFSESNPGFQFEVTLETNNGVSIYQWNGETEVDKTSLTPIDNYFQKAVAEESDGTAGYFYDFYVPLSAIDGLSGVSFNSSTSFRVLASTITRAQSGITGTISDIACIDDNTYNSGTNGLVKCIDSSPEVTVTTLNQLENQKTSKPYIYAPITDTTSIITGASSEASGTNITLNIYESDGTTLDTTFTNVTTVDGSNAWSVDISSVTNLANHLTVGYYVEATATASGKSESDGSNQVQVTTSSGGTVACTVTPQNVLLNGRNGNNGRLGGELLGLSTTNINDLTIKGYNEYSKLVFETGVGNYVFDTSGPDKNATNPLPGTDLTADPPTFKVDGDPNGFSGIAFVTATVQGKCESDFAPVGGSITQSTAPVITPTDLQAGDTQVSGTTANQSDSLYLYVDDALVSKGTNNSTNWTVDGSGNWTVTGLTSFTASQLVYARAKNSTDAISVKSNIVQVGEAPPDTTTAPVITGSYESTDTSVSGYSTEDPGTQVILYINGTSVGDTVRVDLFGEWTFTGLSLSSGDVLTAKAIAANEIISDVSNSVTVVASIPSAPIVSSPILAGASSISGTGGSGTVSVYADGELLGSTTGSSWSLNLSSSAQELVREGVVITATNTVSGAVSPESNQVTVSARPASAISIFAYPASPDAGSVSSVTAEVTDDFGSLVSNEDVDFSLLSGSGTLAADSTNLTTNALGQASIDYTTHTSIETAQVRSEISSTPSINDVVDITSVAGDATQITSVTLDKNTIQVSSGSTTVRAIVKDTNGNVVPNVTVSFSSDQTGSATVGSSGTTDSSGEATATVTAQSSTGDVVITASISSSDDNVATSDNQTTNLTVAAQVPDSTNSSVSASPTTVEADGTSTTTLTINVKDESNTAITGLTEGDFTFNNAGNASSSNFTEVGSGQYTIKFSDNTVEDITIQVDVSGVDIGSTPQISFIDTTLPSSVTLVSPSSAVTRASSGTNNVQTLDVSYSYTEANTESVTIVFNDGTNTATYNIDDSGYAGNGSTKTVTLELSSTDATTNSGFVDGNTYDIEVTATDASSNSASDSGTDLLTIDNTAPSLSSAVVDGSTVTLTYDENLDESSTPAGSDFTVTGSTVGELTPTGVDVSGTTVTLTLGTAIVFGETVTLDYVVPGSGVIQDDGSENDGGALTDQAVTNNTADATNPVVSVSSPTDGEVVQTQNTITGTSTDNDEVASVALEIQRTSNSEYWNGTSWQAEQTTVSASATDGTFDSGDEDWTYDSSSISADDTYTITATATDATGNSVNSSAVSYTIDATAPSGYSVVWDTNPINADNENAAGFTISNGEEGADYNWEITSSGGGTAVTGSDTFSGTTSATISNVDVSGLGDGTLTVTVYLTDEAGNQGSNVTDDVTKDTSIPTVTASQSFNYDENQDTGYEIGSVSASDTEGVTGFTITEGNGGNYFEIDNNGLLTLTATGAGSEANDFETGSNSFSLSITATDAAGNASSAETVTINVDDVDETNPTVQNVTSAKPDGAYTVGEEIDITIEFSESVTVTTTGGTPSLELETGTTDRTATYVSGSESTTLTFRYTVQAGDESSDLEYKNTGALDLNGGTIRDDSDNDASLTLATPGDAGSLGANKDLVIDTDAPTLSSSAPADDATGIAVDTNIELTFSESVTAGTGSIELYDTDGDVLIESFDVESETGTDPGQVSFDGTKVTVNPTNDLDGVTSYNVQIAETAIDDAAGNSYAGITNETDFNFETAAGPAASISLNGPADVTAGEESGNFTITILDAQGNTTNVAQDTDFTLSSEQGGSTFNPTSPITVSNGSSSVTFTYTNSTVGDGTHTITAAWNSGGTDLGSAIHDITVSAGAVSTFFVEAAGGGNIAQQTAGNSFDVDITAQDASGNTVTGFTGTVDLSLNNNSFASGGGTTAAFTNGVLEDHTVQINTADTGYEITATETGETPSGTSTSFDVVPNTPVVLAFGQQPVNTASGANIDPAVTVRIEDAYENLTDATTSLYISIGTNPSGGALSGDIDVAAINGVATFSDLSIDNSGTGYTLVASDAATPDGATGFTDVTSNTFNITTGTATKILVETANDGSGSVVSEQTVTSGNSITAYAIARDASDNFVELVTNATWSLTSKTGSVADGDLVDNEDGSATFTGALMGTAVINAASGSLDKTPSGTITVEPGDATKLAIATQPAGGASGEQLAPQPIIEIQDAAGNVITDDNSTEVSVAILSGDGGTLSGTTSLTATNGVVTYTDLGLAGTVGEDYVLRFTATDLTEADSDPVNVTVGTASTMSVSTQPSTTVAGESIGGAPAVTITDNEGNPVSGIDVTVSINKTTFASGTTTQSTDASGIATFNDLVLNTADTGYQLTFNADAAGVDDVNSSNFEITPAAADQLVITQQPTGGSGSGDDTPTGIGTMIVVSQDAFGNASTVGLANPQNLTVSLLNDASAESNATLGGTLTEDIQSGTATFDDLTLDKDGTGFTVRLTSSGPPNLGTVDSDAFNMSGVEQQDNTAPTIDSVTLAGDNSYIDIEFSEPVYANNDKSGALQISDLALSFTQNGGNATGVSINSLTTTSDAALSGGETTVRVALDITGTPSGAETIEITPADGSSIYDGAGNPAEAIQTTGEQTLKDQLAPTLASSSPSDDATGVVVGTDIELTFSESVNAGTGVIELYNADGDVLVESFNVVDDAGTGAGQVNIDGTTVTVNPTNDLDGVTSYYVQIAETAIDDAAGNSYAGISNQTNLNFETAAGPAASISLNGPSDVTAGEESGNFTISVLDAQGNTTNVAQDTDFTLSSEQGGSTFNPTSPITVSNGSSSVTFTYTNTTVGDGAHTITAAWNSGGTDLGSATHDITVNTGAAATLAKTSGDGQTKTVATTLDDPLVVTITDSEGNPVSGESVSFDITSTTQPGENLSTTSTTTDVNGEASSTLTLGETAGIYEVTVSSGSLDEVVFTATATPGIADATTSLITAADGSITANGTSTTTITVQLKDEYGNNLTTGGETVALSTNTGTLSAGAGGATGDTDVAANDEGNGTYTVTLTSSSSVETATITGTLNSTAITDEETVDFVSGTATQFVFGGASSVTAGVVSGAITVTAQDGSGNTATVTQQTILDLSSNSGGNHTFYSDASGDTEITQLIIGADNSSATFYYSDEKAGTSTITGSQSSGDAIGSNTRDITVNAGPISVAGTGSLLSGTDLTRVADGNEAATITLQLKDEFGNNIEQSDVAVEFATTGGTLSATSVTTNTSGQASITLTSTNAGDFNVTAQVDDTGNGTADASVTNGSPVTVSFEAGAAANIAINAGNNQSGVVTTTLDNELQVKVTDSEGNAVSGVTVDFAISSTPDGTSGQSLSSGTATTDASGLASVNLTLGQLVGTYQVEASVSSPSLGPVTFSATATPGAADATTSLITAADGSITANGTSTTTITVHIRDQYENNLTSGGETVVLSTNAGSLNGVNDEGDGTYTSTLTSSSTVETATITGTLNGDAITDEETVDFVAGSATQFVFGGATSVTAGEVSGAITVTTQDGNGLTATVSEATILDLSSNSGGNHTFYSDAGGTSPITQLTIANGSSSATFYYSDEKAGTSTITGSQSSGDAIGSNTRDIEVGFAALSQFVVSLSSPQTNAEVFTGTNTITAQDEFGNTVEDFDASADNVTLSLSILTGTLSGLGSGSNNVLDQAGDFTNGIANLTNLGLTYTGKVGTGTITATAASGKTGTSESLTIDAGDATQMVYSEQPVNTTAGATITPSVKIQLQDVSGNDVAEEGVSIGIASNQGTLSGTTPQSTDANGVATFGDLSIAEANTGYQLTASATGFDNVNSDLFNITEGAISASESSVSANPTTLVADGNTASTLTIALKDANGNAIGGEEENISLSGLSSATAGTISETGTAGTYEVELTNTTAEQITVTVTADGTTLDDQPVITFESGTVSVTNSSVTADPTSLTAGTNSTVTVTLKDANDNPITTFAEADFTFDLTGNAGLVAGSFSNEGNGVYEVQVTDETAEEISVTVSVDEDGTDTEVGTADITFTPDAAAAVALSADPASPVAGQSTTLTATVTDQFGNLVSGEDVDFSLVSGNGSFDGASKNITTDASGKATATYTTGTTVETAHSGPNFPAMLR